MSFFFETRHLNKRPFTILALLVLLASETQAQSDLPSGTETPATCEAALSVRPSYRPPAPRVSWSSARDRLGWHYAAIVTANTKRDYRLGFELLGDLLSANLVEESPVALTAAEAQYLSALLQQPHVQGELWSVEKTINALTAAHHPLVFRYASGVVGRTTLFEGSNAEDDVVQELMIALREAIVTYAERPDLREAYAFSTVAFNFFRKGLLSNLLRGPYGVQTTSSIVFQRKIIKVQKNLAERGNFSPSPREILDEFRAIYREKTTEAKIFQRLQVLVGDGLRVRERPQEDPDSLVLGTPRDPVDLLVDDGPRPDDVLEFSHVSRLLDDVVHSALNPRQRAVVEMRVGWGAFEGAKPATLEEVAAALDISFQRVAAIQSEALKRIRGAWAERGLSDEVRLSLRGLFAGEASKDAENAKRKK